MIVAIKQKRSKIRIRKHKADRIELYFEKRIWDLENLLNLIVKTKNEEMVFPISIPNNKKIQEIVSKDVSYWFTIFQTLILDEEKKEEEVEIDLTKGGVEKTIIKILNFKGLLKICKPEKYLKICTNRERLEALREWRERYTGESSEETLETIKIR